MSKPSLLLTGASGRFGAAFLSAYADKYRFICLSSNQLLCTQNNMAEPHNADVWWVYCDLRLPETIESVLRNILAFEPNIFRLINAAGDTKFYGDSSVSRFQYENMTRQFVVNTIAPNILFSTLFEFCWKNMPIERPAVSVLNISSVSSTDIYKNTGQVGYAMSKSALNISTQYMAADYSDYNIRANAICPGAFPASISTEKVVKSAHAVLEGTMNGQVYNIK
jgi:NAD(P)-dependent dehydrogenase (short-subunit alcohol dehydrogenase family)